MMQTGLRFIQDQKTRRASRQQHRHPQQVTQRAIRKLGCLEWTKQTMLLHLYFEPSFAVGHGNTGARKRIGDGIVEGV
jgi:hypothetical protein